MMNWKGERVLITGIDGFVARNLAQVLLDSGAQVAGILHRPEWKPRDVLPLRSIAADVQAFVGDISIPQVAEDALQASQPQWVFHLAAQAIVTQAEREPLPTVETNIRGTYNVLLAASRCPCVQAVLIASSDKAYGLSAQLPYTESTPLRGNAIYDASKACADLLAQSLARSQQLPVGITRCANVYGPGDLHFSRIIPDVMRSLARGERPVIRGTGLQERDFIHVSDAVEAYLCLAAYVKHHKASVEAFNFGTGRPIRIVDLVAQILSASGRTDLEPVVLGKAAPFEIASQSLDSARAREMLGWIPRVTSEDGLASTFRWYCSLLGEGA
jgi:CDP-glucose 4,6-dehydratase